MHPLVDADRFALFGFIAIGVTNIAQLAHQFAFETGFLAHLAQRRFLHPLAFLDMSLGQPPAVAHMNQCDFEHSPLRR